MCQVVSSPTEAFEFHIGLPCVYYPWILCQENICERCWLALIV